MTEQTAEQKRLATLFEAIAPPREQQFYSVGHCCVFFDINPAQLKVLMDEADVAFKRLVDTVLYVDGHDLQKLVDVYNAIYADIQAAADAVPNS